MSQLPFIESLNIQTTIKFDGNKILINAGGQEQRIVPHQAPLREFNLSKKSLTPAEVAAIYALFQSCEGRKNPFLYTDKSDYEATRNPKNLAAGVTTQGVVINSNGQYLLCKKYTCGVNVHYRPIYSATDLTIYTSEGSVATGWTFNPGGVITGLTGSGHTATFNFDVLVRFSTDELDSVIETKKVNPVYSLNVTLVEQRFYVPFWFVDQFNDDCAHLFAIDFLFKSTTSQVFNNQQKDLASGFNKIVQYQTQPITEVTFGERSALSQLDIEYMQAFWLCVKGSGAFWSFEGADEAQVLAAFRDNALSYTLTAPQPKQYSVSPLTARLFYEGTWSGSSYNGYMGSVLTLCDCVAIPEQQEMPTVPYYWFYELTGQEFVLPGGVPTFQRNYYWGDDALNTGAKQGEVVRYLPTKGDPRMGQYPVNIQFAQSTVPAPPCDFLYWSMSTNGSSYFGWDDAAQLWSYFDWNKCTINYKSKPTPTRLYRYPGYQPVGGSGGFDGVGTPVIFTLGSDYLWNESTGAIQWISDPQG